MSEERTLARRLLDEVAGHLSAERKPLATYRVQLHKGFAFADAAELLPYLRDLGVTDLYTSPILTAAPGSQHGYDVIDHQTINAELGGQEGYDALAARLAEHRLGHLLDIVPNHMGITSGNALWRDVLENGPSAQAARFFDVEWHPVKEELEDKVLVPILGDRFGAVLERGELQLRLAAGAFEIAYFDNVFPVNPRSYTHVLGHRLDELEARVPHGDAMLDELKSILTALGNMPARHEQDPLRREERRREKEVAKRRVAALCAASEPVRQHLEENVRLFNGTPGDARSYDLLERLLDAQAYRLAHWRVSSEEINYRRFFDINSLAAIRVEDAFVFEEAHRVPLRLIAEGKVTGLRIDHPDGLAYPTRYFRLLQDAHIVERARATARAHGLLEEHPWEQLEPLVRQELARDLEERGAASPFFRPLFVVAEKILGRTERLPASWAVHGTTGYDFVNALNGIFVERGNADALEKTYARFIGASIDFDEIVYQKKKLILYTALASEMNLLARQLNRISERNRWTRDFTLYSLRAALIELAACFPVYRTYLDERGQVDDRDRRYVAQAVASARRRNPTENASIYDFVADILLQRFGKYVSDEERGVQHAFAIKLQQVLGPVMAKGVEDTAFYVYNRLLALNEVGGEPQHFGGSVEAFHAQNAHRATDWRSSLLATATHDTKRGEDLRARLDALSELPLEWRRALASFQRSTDRLRRDVDGRPAPDRNEQMLFFQTLLGVWPNPAPGSDPTALPAPAALAPLRERLQAYLFKAVKEAKVHTSWIQENPEWEQAVTGFADALFAQPESDPFWRAFLPFQRRLAQIGMHTSLAQVLLKIASPGVPDIYQGCELWDLSLVDPDNRRPVDYAERRDMLAAMERTLTERSRAELAAELYRTWEDGRIKLYVTRAALRVRREHPLLLGSGGYQPLQPSGPNAQHLCAFARTAGEELAVTVAPRLVSSLLQGDLRAASLPGAAFAGTMVPVPSLRVGEQLRDALTGETRTVFETPSGPALAVDQLFATLPLALLLRT